MERSLPRDEEHLELLFKFQAALAVSPRQNLRDPQWQAISIAMSAMYQAATCHRGCNGGAHVPEALVGRCYNLASAACSLIRIAQYDEALNLIRSMGEIHNLLLLLALEPESIPIWLASDKKRRLKEFGPAAVRRRIAVHGPVPIVNDDWYAEMCESFVHIQPGTRPNKHSEISGWVGSLVQPEGEARAVGELFQVSVATAFCVCRLFGFADIQQRIGSHIESMRAEG